RRPAARTACWASSYRTAPGPESPPLRCVAPPVPSAGPSRVIAVASTAERTRVHIARFSFVMGSGAAPGTGDRSSTEPCSFRATPGQTAQARQERLAGLEHFEASAPEGLVELGHAQVAMLGLPEELERHRGQEP